MMVFGFTLWTAALVATPLAIAPSLASALRDRDLVDTAAAGVLAAVWAGFVVLWVIFLAGGPVW